VPDSAPGDVFVSPPSDAQVLTPQCDPNTKWGTPTNVAGVAAFTSRPVVTITADGLTVAWVIDAGNGSGSLYVADRSADTATFAAPHLVSQMMGTSGEGGATQYFAFDRVALFGNGKSIVAVTITGGEMAEFYRDARTGLDGGPLSFSGMPLPSRYSAIAGSLLPGETLTDPVLSNDGQDLIYSKKSQGTATVYESFTSGSNSWGNGVPQGLVLPAVDAGAGGGPSGLAEDRLTLFVWHEAQGVTEAVSRTSTTGAFGTGLLVGGKPDAAVPAWSSVQSSHACKRLYFVAPSGSGFAFQHVDAL
jgi:hypothetical protein